MKKSQAKTQKRTARHARIRARVIGTAEKPRLAVFKSNRFIYAQLIDDDAGKTLLNADSRQLKGENPVEKASAVGEAIAKSAKDKKIVKVVFDRGGFPYQGAIAALADAARKGGLEF